MVFNTSNSFLIATSCQLLFTWIIERKERWYKGGGWEGGGGWGLSKVMPEENFTQDHE